MGVLNVSLMILVYVTCMLVPSTGKIMTVNRLIHELTMQTEPMPNCTVQFVYNTDLLADYVLESYNGSMIIECNATITGQAIRNATMEALLEKAYNMNLTMCFTFYCNNYTGSVDLMYLDRRNLIYYKIVECILNPTNTPLRIYNPKNDNLIYFENDNSFMHPLLSTASYIHFILYYSSMPCIYGRKTKFFYELGPNLTDINIIIDKHYLEKLSQYLLRKTVHKYLQLFNKSPKNHMPKTCSRLLIFKLTDTNTHDHNAIMALKTAPNLGWLSLSATGLTNVPAVVVDMVESTSLGMVDMSRNNITRFSFNLKVLNTFWPGENYTKSVILARCQIETIPLENVKQMFEYPFVHVDISDNPIHCNCDLKPALQYMYAHSDYFNTSYYKYLWDIKCVAPLVLRGVRLREVPVDEIPTKYRLNYKGRTQTEPMPNCTVVFVPNCDLNADYVLESYDGIMKIECNATIPGQVIRNATMEAMLEKAHIRNLTLFFTFYCNNYTGSVDLMYLDRRNLVYYKTVECILSPTDIPQSFYNQENDNLVYFENDNSFMHPLQLIYIYHRFMLYYGSKQCVFGRKTKYFIEKGPNVGDMYFTDAYCHNKLLQDSKSICEYLQYLKHASWYKKKQSCPSLVEFELTDTNNHNLDRIKYSTAALNVIRTAPNLKKINLSATGLTNVPAAVVDKVESTSLATVDMSRNNITGFSFDPKLLNAIKPEEKSYNSVYTDPFIPGGNYHTKSVILTRCQIETILLDNVKQMFEYPFLHVDISDNPIKCNCDLKPALEYMYNHSDYFNTSYYKYLWDIKCVAPPAFTGASLCDVPLDELCPPDKVRTVLAPLLSVSVLLVLVVITSICLHRHRTTVQALIHNFICIKCCPRKYIDYQNEGRNGVFVTYSYDDVEVADNLIERLQTNIPPIRVNSEQDTMTNAPWLTELDRMVRTSFYTVMLLSKNFMDDVECMMAFRMAYEHSIIERHQSLIAVMVDSQEELGEIQDPTLKLFLRFNNYLNYNQLLFSEKLVHALLRNPQNVVFDPEEMERII